VRPFWAIAGHGAAFGPQGMARVGRPRSDGTREGELVTTPTTVFSRVTVVAPQTRIDVALPADVAVADLLAMLLEVAPEGGAVSDRTRQLRDEEQQHLSDEALRGAARLINEHRDKLDALASALLRNEVLERGDIDRIMEGVPRAHATYESYIENTPMGDVGQPEDVAHLTRFLIGPWPWMILVYTFDEPDDAVYVVAVHDGRSSSAATHRR